MFFLVAVFFLNGEKRIFKNSILNILRSCSTHINGEGKLFEVKELILILPDAAKRLTL